MTAIALTIAGSDSGGGAGIQADLKAMSALGVYGASAITAITAQNTRGVFAVQEVGLTVIAEQVRAVLDDLDVRAIKIGMLATSEIIETVVASLSQFQGPVVVDPVMLAKSGDPLLADDAILTLRTKLLPRAHVLTPNLPEAACLLGLTPATSVDDMKKQGHALCGMGARSVLMKGGHAEGETCKDVLVCKDGTETEYSAPRIATSNTHGTGCTLSASIAAGLAKGLQLSAAVFEAHQYLQGAIQAADRIEIGEGYGPVHHFHEIWNQ